MRIIEHNAGNIRVTTFMEGNIVIFVYGYCGDKKYCYSDPFICDWFNIEVKVDVYMNVKYIGEHGTRTITLLCRGIGDIIKRKKYAAKNTASKSYSIWCKFLVDRYEKIHNYIHGIGYSYFFAN